MRDWINIVEQRLSENFDPGVLEAYEFLSGYVTDGVWRDGYKPGFDDLMQTLARPAKAMRLFRVLSVSPEDKLALQTGRPITIEDRPYSSWTKSRACVASLVARRRDTSKPTIVIQKTVQPQDIVVDIDAFYRTHEFNCSGYDEYGQYVIQEKEVIVKHQGFKSITPEMVLPFDDSPADFKAPKVGDWFVNSSGKREKIKAVNSEQPYAEHGLFYATDSLGSGIQLLSIPGGKWRER